jgi:putative RecB family exonuclease
VLRKQRFADRSRSHFSAADHLFRGIGEFMSEQSNTPESATPEEAREPERVPVKPSKAFGWDKGSLVVVDSEVMDRYNTGYLSPSTAKSMDGCPARWAAERALPRHEDPFGAAEIGTSGHSVLEDLYSLPGDERSAERAMLILLDHAKEMWPGKDDESRAKKAEWISAVHDAYKGLFLVEDPAKIVVFQTELRADDVEVAGVPFKGFIDRVDLTPNGFKVVDYKTGKVPQNITRFGDDHGDQIRLYAEVIRVLHGKFPVEGGLHYTKFGKYRSVPLNKTSMNKVLAKFKKSWVDLNVYTERAAFPTKTSALCGWCPLVNSCPAAAADGKVDRKGDAQSKTDLGIPVLRTFDAAELTPAARRKANETPDLDLDFGWSEDEPVRDEPVLPAVVAHPVDDIEPLDEEVLAIVEAAADVTTEALTVIEQVLDEVEPIAEETPEQVIETGSEEPPPAHLAGDTKSHQTNRSEGDTMSNRLTEGKPWEETVNGSLNPGSYAATAVFGTASLAYEEIVKAGIKPTRESIDALAQTFASIVDEAQVKLTGISSYQESANTRLRGCLRTFLDLHALPFGKGVEDWDAWVRKAKGHIPSIANAAVRLYESDLSGSPWTQLAIREADSEFEEAAG